ncbi:MAG: hypothetical protein PHF86_05875 [Candidatus Nanoarchaeia archaeon]|nr:hypothetical protein [Candidatus Nanoarchaeia archaeon]
MKIPKLLIILFLIVFLFRLYFVLQTNYFSDDSSYGQLRIMDSVKESGIPLGYDTLSYGGKQILPSLLFPYILWLFSLVPYGLKIFPQLIISLLVIIVYYLSKEIINNEKLALIAATLAGFTPLLINETLNKISVYFLAIPLIFFMIYAFNRIKEINYKIIFYITAIIISLLDPIFLCLVFVFIFYLILMYTEDVKLHKSEITSIIIFSIIIILINLYILKDALVLYGLDIIYKNIPKSLLINTFKKIDVLTLVYHLGYIPLIFGFIALYHGFVKEKSRIIYLISSLIFVSLSLVALNVLNFYVGLVLVGIAVSILSIISINRLIIYLNLTKLSKYNSFFIPILLILILLFSIYPSYEISKKLISDVSIKDEIDSLLWIKNNSEQNDVIIGTIYEGNLISYFSNRKNFFDTSFLFVQDPLQRMIDAEKVFTQDYSSASEVFKKYNIKYIFLSDKAKAIYGIKDLKYKDSNCLEKYDFVYKIIC